MPGVVDLDGVPAAAVIKPNLIASVVLRCFGYTFNHLALQVNYALKKSSINLDWTKKWTEIVKFLLSKNLLN